jgi:predicted transglutaminase-like cysteine proteinase
MYWRLLPICMIVAGVSTDRVDAWPQPVPDPHLLTSIVGAAPVLAPFQHVRFCLRYPTECRPNSTAQRIEFDIQTMELLDRVNRDVNLSIVPTLKAYDTDLTNKWTIAPDKGDCNDYAVTKRHDLIQSGLPSGALRLSVIKTPFGEGHLVLVVATTKGDVVLDNLTSAIRPWQMTEYQWIKIQSATDPRLWNEVKSPDVGLTTSRPELKLTVAGR